MSRAQSVDVLWSGIRTSTGAAVSGGKVWTYLAGTTTESALYANQSKTAYQTNPIILDSNGKAEAWADGAYKFIITTSEDVSVDTIDNLIYGFDDPVSIWGGTSGGSANTQTLTPSPAITAYSDGQTISFIVGYENTGTTTLNVSGLGAITIKNGDGSNLSSGTLVVGNVVTVVYNSGVFVLSTTNSFTSISVSGTATCGAVSTAQLTHSSNMTIDPSGTLTITPTNNLTIGPTGASADLLLQAGNTVHWTIDQDGVMYPTKNGASVAGQDIGTSLRYIECLYVQDVIVNGAVLAPTGASALYLGISPTAYITIDSDGVLWSNTTSGTTDLGKSSRRFKDFYLDGKIDAGQGSYTYSGTDAYSAVRSINWDAVTCGTGTDTVNKTTLNAALLSAFRAIATMWKDFYGG